MKLTLQSDNVSVKYGDVTLNGVSVLELVESLNDSDLVELVEAIKTLKPHVLESDDV